MLSSGRLMADDSPSTVDLESLVDCTANTYPSIRRSRWTIRQLDVMGCVFAYYKIGPGFLLLIVLHLYFFIVLSLPFLLSFYSV
jgi:hypothetical protein